MADVTYCPRCSNRLRTGARFCTRCGLGLAQVPLMPSGAPRGREAVTPVLPTVPAQRALQEYAAPWKPARAAPAPAQPVVAAPVKPKARVGCIGVLVRFVAVLLAISWARQCVERHERWEPAPTNHFYDPRFGTPTVPSMPPPVWTPRDFPDRPAPEHHRR